MTSFSGRIVGALLIVACGHRIVRAAPAAQSDSRFVLIVSGELQTAVGNQPLVQAKVIHAKDQLVLTITASRSVTAFVAYCDSQAKQQVYGPLAVSPDGAIDVPQDGYFVADNNPGPEHVFVVASTEILQNTDPKLDRILRFEDSEHTCGDTLAMTTKESRSQRANKESDAPTIAPVSQQARANVAMASSRKRPSNYPVAAGPSRVRGFELRKNAGRTHAGGTFATQSDDYGIAIVAFTFDHR